MSGRELLRTLSSQAPKVGAAPSIVSPPATPNLLPSIKEFSEIITIAKPTELVGSAPALYFTESDQTDPAGRFRERIASDIWYFERAKTAAWATISELIKIDRTNMQITLLNDPTYGDCELLLGGNGYLALTANNLSLILKAGKTSGADYGPTFQLDGYLVGGAATLFTPYAGGGGGSMRLQVTGGVATARMDILNSVVNIAVDSTVPDNTTTTAGQVRFIVDGSDQLTAYWNKAGSILSLVIGTLA